MQVGTELDMGEVDMEEHRDRRGSRHEGRNKSKYGNINASRHGGKTIVDTKVDTKLHM